MDYDTVKVIGNIFLSEGATLMIGPAWVVQFRAIITFWFKAITRCWDS
jgi:hypothetical protein